MNSLPSGFSMTESVFVLTAFMGFREICGLGSYETDDSF